MCRISFFLNLLDQNNILNIIRVCMFIIFYIISLLFFNYFEFSDNETFPPNETIKADRMNISTDPGNGLGTITKTNGQ